MAAETVGSVLAAGAVLAVSIACLGLDMGSYASLLRQHAQQLLPLATSLATPPPPPPPPPFACLPHAYTTTLISVDPLVVYIHNFTTPAEAASIAAAGAPHLVSSPVAGRAAADASRRTSRSAPLDARHPAVACVLARARAFTGATLPDTADDDDDGGGTQMVRYDGAGQRFDLHTDWFARPRVLPADAAAGRRRMYNRAATFFAVLECSGCGAGGGETWFPRVGPVAAPKAGQPWRVHEQGGVAFAPMAGNAVFWVNLFPRNGTGDARVVHAGLPVAEGSVKTAINIWPRVFFGPDA